VNAGVEPSPAAEEPALLTLTAQLPAALAAGAAAALAWRLTNNGLQPLPAAQRALAIEGSRDRAPEWRNCGCAAWRACPKCPRRSLVNQ
jgi:hypothetical protein